MGVHGDSQVVAWSDATIGGIPLDKSLSLNKFLDREELSNECRNRSQRIMFAKGATPLGIGSVICSICSSILLDKRNIRPISHFQPEWGCCFSLPVVLGRAGIMRTIEMPMDTRERVALHESVRELMATIEKIKEVQPV